MSHRSSMTGTIMTYEQVLPAIGNWRRLLMVIYFVKMQNTLIEQWNHMKLCPTIYLSILGKDKGIIKLILTFKTSINVIIFRK